MIDPNTGLETPIQANDRHAEAFGGKEAAMVRVLLRVLSGRATAVSGAIQVFVIACWAMWQPTWPRVAIAAGFAVFSLLAQTLLAWAER